MGTPLREPMRLSLPTDKLILDELTEGRNIAANLAVQLDRHRNYINQRMGQLNDYGLVRKIGPAENSGLYEITEKGRVALSHIDEYEEADDFDAVVKAAMDRCD